MANKLGKVVDQNTGEIIAQVFGPPNALTDGADELSKWLYFLSEAIIRGILPDQRRDGLGGEFGYGADYENDVFMMHPYCWCEKPDCPWCAGCSCKNDGADARMWYVGDERVASDAWHAAVLAAIRAGSIRGWQESSKIGRVIHGKECFYATHERNAPNFLHKKTGVSVRWYKWIGRDMELRGDVPDEELGRIFQECWESLPPDARARAKAGHDYENTPTR